MRVLFALVSTLLLVPVPGRARTSSGGEDAPGVAESLFLIGDAGQSHAGREPVLVSLRRKIFVSRAPSKTVAFLGDRWNGVSIRPYPASAEIPIKSAQERMNSSRSRVCAAM
jgi:hypothetical protein